MFVTFTPGRPGISASRAIKVLEQMRLMAWVFSKNDGNTLSILKINSIITRQIKINSPLLDTDNLYGPIDSLLKGLNSVNQDASIDKYIEFILCKTNEYLK